ncbi:hypothetical protein H5410_050992 [Solanum commersonii]|uniref:ATP-dependent DNA helicase n=1 Tax=Solanum commersonii TaxID=4109 RepID=A0A9J5WYP3_SOLCO|nr:hypothetical protein H5410_050992 [Solanum commersonii]
MITLVKVRGHNIDTSWIIPYNPFFLKKFGCHINVEICFDIVKYIYKYICKEHDKIAFFVHNNDTNVEIDEIKEYQFARWVSPPETAWRLFAFSISEITPSVCQLQLHLDGQQFVSFKNNQTVDQIINNIMIKKMIVEQDILLESKLNVEQKRAYNIILEILYSNKSGAFFSDGPGGTRKTFLYRALLAAIRTKGFIALATVSSGVAASILLGG